MNAAALQPNETNVFAPTAFRGEGEDVAAITRAAVTRARETAEAWREVSLGERLRCVKRARHLIAERALELAKLKDRPAAETLTAEVLPLAEACRFLERNAAKTLATENLGASGRPVWLRSVASEIRREPYGVVLIIAPANYPLFLPAVQTLQALVAGNGVLLKPGNSGSPAARKFVELLHHAGFPRGAVQLLPESVLAATTAIDCGVDKVVLTGSAETGVAVLRQLAPRLTPAICELSGEDVVVIRADADLDLAARAVAFGLRLNGGETCIAPRRILVHQSVADEFKLRLAAHNSEKENAVTTCVANDDEALAVAAQSPYALGASIFSRDEAAARDLAGKLNAGIVTINDLIVPTADPRIPFGGRGRSGFGVTRGAEGLLALTVPKVVQLRTGKSRPHFDPTQEGDAELFAAFIRTLHAKNLREKFAAFRELMRRGAHRLQNSRRKKQS